MKLHFLGANRQVTGSRYCLEVAGKQVLIDCGMFQERKFLNRNLDRCPIPAADVEALLLTHVHIDHSGLIPKLVKEGFRGPIYATRPSIALADVLLRDSAEIQMEDIEYKQKRHRKENRTSPYPYEPLYTVEDVDSTLRLLKPAEYLKPVQVTDGIKATFHDAGHILGSAMIEIEATEGDITRHIVFSGDIGQWDKPLIHDPSLLEHADYLVMESTYGDRDHERAGDLEMQFETIVNETHARGGNVVIPTFAVERAQELMYYFSRLVHSQRIPRMSVFLDSPMAVDVTEIFRDFREFLDAETFAMMNAHTPPLRFPGLEMIRTANQSKAINFLKTPCIIMASSGMCTAGRIKHHLRNNISRADSTILFVGYQGDGTLGRQILDGNKRVRIHGQEFNVRARIAQIYGFSGHADRSGLLRWLTNFKQPPRQIFFTHGEEKVSLKFAEHVQRELKWPALVPQYRQVVELR